MANGAPLHGYHCPVHLKLTTLVKTLIFAGPVSSDYITPTMTKQ